MRILNRIGYTVFISLAILLQVKNAAAQQEPEFTQYMDNLLIINPGFAGSRETGSIILTARNQWVSFEGAPATRTLSYNLPLTGKKIGLGFSILSDKIGPLKQNGFYFDYSYFLKIGAKYRLGLGLKAGFSFYRASLTDLQTVSPDPIYSQDIFKNFLPNFGVGTFLYSDDTYLGISIPKLMENKINREDYSSEYVSKERIHVYAIAGKKFNLADNFQLKTHSMIRLIKNTPVSLDLAAILGFKEKLWAGGTFRVGDSYGILAQFNVTEKLLIGYSYDLTYSKLNTFSNGTHEILLSYNFRNFSKKTD